jgi:lipid-binding SYLF domain-containing protein
MVQQDDDSTRAVYGKSVPFRAVLSGKTATPEIASEFMKAVSDASRQAHVAEAKEEAKK